MTDTTKPNPFLATLITLVVPALILMKLSDPERLGVLPALLLALAFPLAWGMRDLIRSSKLNLFAALGLVSVGLTGGIGLLQLDNQWLAVKEAAIPGIIGLVVFVSGHTRYSLIHALLLNPKLIDVARIRQQLSMRGTTRIFEKRLRTACPSRKLISHAFTLPTVRNDAVPACGRCGLINGIQQLDPY